MRKVLIAFFTLVIIGAISYLLIPVKNDKKHFDYSLCLNTVPSNATFVFRCDNIVKKWSEFNNSTIGQVVQGTNSHSTFNNFLNQLDSSKSAINSNFFKEKIFVSGVLTAGNQMNYLVSLETKDYPQEKISTYIKEILGDSPISVKEYDLVKITNYKHEEGVVFSAQKEGVLLFSTSSILIEEAIRQLKAEKHLPDEPGFKKLLKTADLASDGNFFINLSSLGSYMDLFANKQKSFKRSFSEFGGWSELDLNARDESLMFNGFSFISDSTDSYLKSFTNEKAQSLNISSVLPENTGVLKYLSYSSFESYKAKYDKYLSQKQILYKHQKNVLNINKKHSFNVETDFYGWIGDEIGLFIINGDESSFDQNTGLIIKLSDLEKAKEGLSEIHKSTNIEDTKEYQSFEIKNLGLTNFFSLVLGDEFSEVKGSNYLIIEDYVVFANSVSTLKHVVNFYLRGKTLVKNIQFNRFYEQFSSESNLFYYYNFKLAKNYFSHVLNEDYQKSFELHLDSINKLQAFGLQVNAKKNLFFTNAFVDYSSAEEAQNISLIEIKLDTTYSVKPWVVKNHYTKELEIIIQDDNNKIYLINNVGKVLWERQLDEKIVGDVCQVDRYKNDKLQYAFVTSTNIQQIDRKGRDVSGFPVQLKAPVTKGLVVLDYDNNRNYRMLVVQGGNIHNFKVDGKIVKGWKFKPSNSKIAVTPELLQVNNKDYILLADAAGNVRAINRKGEDRIKLSNQLPDGTKNHQIWNNKALSNSGVLATDTNGTVFFVKVADELETFTIKSFSPGFKLNYQDFNGDDVLDFVAIEDQSIKVFKNNKKPLLEIADIDFDPAYGVESFKLNDGQINLITNKEEMEVYGYDESGNLLNGFPIEGVSPSLVVDLDGNKTSDLIIGDKLGSVYIYSLGR